MVKRWLLGVTLGMSVAGAALAQSVVSFTEQDLAGLVGTACGQAPADIKKVHVHRNAAGNMLYVVAEGQAEALIYAQQQNCNPLAKETLNVWRNNRDGAVTAQLASRYETKRLLIGQNPDGIAGNGFDVEPSGQYLLVSRGNVSSISPVDRPYVQTVELQMDAQRLFLRQNGLIVVGSNPTTNQLEAVPVSLQGGSAIAGAPIVVPGVPAGVVVLDYNEKSDELLLGGLNASGVTSFAIANLSSGGARLVDNVKPGAVTALFVSDAGLVARLGGQAASAGRSVSGNENQPQQGQPQQKRGWFGGLFGRK